MWRDSSQSGLSRETFLAVEHTCRSVAELSEYLIFNFKFKFAMTGKFLSDSIVKRFGYYRQLSGANYFVSIRQKLEYEKNIRLVSLLKFSQLSLIFSKLWETSLFSITLILPTWIYPVIFYVSGYISRSLKKRKMLCFEILRSPGELEISTFPIEGREVLTFFNELFRGRLTCPSEFVFMTAVVCFCLFEKLCSAPIRGLFCLWKIVELYYFVELTMRKISSDSFLESMLNSKC